MLARRARPRESRHVEGRLITRNPEDWEIQRREVYDREQGLCEGLRCGREAPLHNVKGPNGEIVLRAGEAHHKTKRKVRDDRAVNLKWLCWSCHEKAERGQKPVPAKVIEAKLVMLEDKGDAQ